MTIQHQLCLQTFTGYHVTITEQTNKLWSVRIDEAYTREYALERLHLHDYPADLLLMEIHRWLSDHDHR